MTPWTVRLSAQMYQRLLVAYPQSFRRVYGAPMLQVFRDCCRDAASTGGTTSLLRYWLIAFGDLIMSALAERRREEVHMSRTSWIRLGSLAAIISGVIATVFVALSLTVAIAQLLDENSSLGVALFPVHVVSWGAPALVVFDVLALIGLQARGASRAGVVGWISITGAILGLIVAALGSGLTSVVMYSQAGSCYSPLNCNFYDPDRYLLMGYMGGMLGSVIFAIGMIVFGITALRRRVLPRHNWLLLTIGLILLLNIATSVIAMLVSGGSDYAGTQKVVIMLSVLPLASAILWIALGGAMRPRGDEETVVQSVPTPVEPAV